MFKIILGYLAIATILLLLAVAPWLIIPIVILGYVLRPTPRNTVSTIKTPTQTTKTPSISTVEWSIVDKQAYLKTEAWNERRKQRLKLDNYICRQCEQGNLKLSVHHLTYENLGQEPMEDLVSVCQPCHDAIHNESGYDYKDNHPLLRKSNETDNSRRTGL